MKPAGSFQPPAGYKVKGLTEPARAGVAGRLVEQQQRGQLSLRQPQQQQARQPQQQLRFSRCQHFLSRSPVVHGQPGRAQESPGQLLVAAFASSRIAKRRQEVSSQSLRTPPDVNFTTCGRFRTSRRVFSVILSDRRERRILFSHARDSSSRIKRGTQNDSFEVFHVSTCGGCTPPAG